MTDWNDLPNEMRRPKLDEDTVDRLLAGRIGPDDAPPGYSEVARVLVAAASSNDRDALVHETEHVALAAALLGQPTPVSKPSDGRSRSMKRSRRMKVGGLVVVGAMVGSTGLAAAGVLPDAAQDAFSAVLERGRHLRPGERRPSDERRSSGELRRGDLRDRHDDGCHRREQRGRDLVRGERRREPGRGAWLERGGCGWLGCG
jgi:hypothetical protein